MMSKKRSESQVNKARACKVLKTDWGIGLSSSKTFYLVLSGCSKYDVSSDHARITQKRNRHHMRIYLTLHWVSYIQGNRNQRVQDSFDD